MDDGARGIRTRPRTQARMAWKGYSENGQGCSTRPEAGRYGNQPTDCETQAIRRAGRSGLAPRTWRDPRRSEDRRRLDRRERADRAEERLGGKEGGGRGR